MNDRRAIFGYFEKLIQCRCGLPSINRPRQALSLLLPGAADATPPAFVQYPVSLASIPRDHVSTIVLTLFGSYRAQAWARA
jgi:hypothetical protein